jgi:hypothetical protein
VLIRKRRRSGVSGGFYRFESMRTRTTISGSGYGEFIRLRDEFGNVWRGEAERQDDDTIRYRFRDSNGKTISGMSDTFGVVLRDEKGNVWRGFVD